MQSSTISGADLEWRPNWLEFTAEDRQIIDFGASFFASTAVDEDFAETYKLLVPYASSLPVMSLVVRVTRNFDIDVMRNILCDATPLRSKAELVATVAGGTISICAGHPGPSVYR